MTREEILSKAKPILFSTDMVRAIQDGRKTATRRVCHIKINGNTPVNHKLCYTAEYPETNIDGLCANFYDNEHFYKGCAKPPYQIGDHLYVRETWCKLTDWEDQYPDCEEDMLITYYKADYFKDMYNEAKWRPSIHMPKEAARIFLRVTDVRVKRLQDITAEQIEREGVYQDPKIYNWYTVGNGVHNSSQMRCFRSLWNSTIKKSDLDCYGWVVNPWVWVIEFERVEVEP